MSSNFKIRKIYSSDSKVPEEELEGNENKVVVKICKVCKQPLAETASIIICAGCGHYAHTEHSHMFQMAPHCNLCIIQITKVDKRMFKVLCGLMLEFNEYVLKKAARFSDMEFNEAKRQLILSRLVEQKNYLLILRKLRPTYTAHEVYPVLEEIYRQEPDVDAFIGNLFLVRKIPIIGRFLP